TRGLGDIAVVTPALSGLGDVAADTDCGGSRLYPRRDVVGFRTACWQNRSLRQGGAHRLEIAGTGDLGREQFDDVRAGTEGVNHLSGGECTADAHRLVSVGDFEHPTVEIGADQHPGSGIDTAVSRLRVENRAGTDDNALRGILLAEGADDAFGTWHGQGDLKRSDPSGDRGVRDGQRFILRIETNDEDGASVVDCPEGFELR